MTKKPQDDLFKSQTLTVDAETQRQWSLAQLPRTKVEDLVETVPPSHGVRAGEEGGDADDKDTVRQRVPSRDDPTWVTERVRKKRAKKTALVASVGAAVVLLIVLVWAVTRRSDASDDGAATATQRDREARIAPATAPKRVGAQLSEKKGSEGSAVSAEGEARASEVEKPLSQPATQPRPQSSAIRAAQPHQMPPATIPQQLGNTPSSVPSEPANPEPARAEPDSTSDQEKPSWFNLEQ